MDRSTKQEINKETQTLNNTRDQLDTIDIYKGGAPTYGAEKCSLFWWVFVFLETLKNMAP